MKYRIIRKAAAWHNGWTSQVSNPDADGYEWDSKQEADDYATVLRANSNDYTYTVQPCVK